LKTKQKKGLVLKLDLHKAYDYIRWDFLRLLLIQISISLSMVDWIMGYISSVTFVALINGGPTNFFKSSRGIRKRCPISSLMFILVMEWLSLLLIDAQNVGKISGVSVDRILKNCHILFVDDVLLMNISSIEE